jgi:iron complex transport system ATP-binding protein
VLVTHHVEEIRPTFSHALLLRSGRVLAGGPRPGVLTSQNLSETFGAPMRLVRRNNRYQVSIQVDTSQSTKSVRAFQP